MASQVNAELVVEMVIGQAAYASVGLGAVTGAAKIRYGSARGCAMQ